MEDRNCLVLWWTDLSAQSGPRVQYQEKSNLIFAVVSDFIYHTTLLLLKSSASVLKKYFYIKLLSKDKAENRTVKMHTIYQMSE